MKQSCFLIFLLLFPVLTFAQNNVSYNLEKEIDQVEKQYVDAWKKIKKIDGFRIQIASFQGTNSKNSIERVATQFKQLFPDIPNYVAFFEPYFRLRVGNYATKLEAYRALNAISGSFPGAFVVKDQIDIKQ
jgi:hypothetical protein